MLRSNDGENWTEHNVLASDQSIADALDGSFQGQCELGSGHSRSAKGSVDVSDQSIADALDGSFQGQCELGRGPPRVPPLRCRSNPPLPTPLTPY